jgi:hypothetical protein
MKKLSAMFQASLESETTTGDVDTQTPAPIEYEALITQSEDSLSEVNAAHDEVVDAHADVDTVLETAEHIGETFEVAVESIAQGGDYAAIRPIAVANLRYAFRRLGLEGEINGAESEGESHGVEVPAVEPGESTGIAPVATDVMGDNSVESPKDAEATPTSSLVVEHVDGVECESGVCPICGGASLESLGSKAKTFAETVIRALKAAWERVVTFFTKSFNHLQQLKKIAEVAKEKSIPNNWTCEVDIPNDPNAIQCVKHVSTLLANAHKLLDNGETSVSNRQFVETELKQVKITSQNAFSDKLNEAIELIDHACNLEGGIKVLDSKIKSFNPKDLSAKVVADINTAKHLQTLASSETRVLVTYITSLVHGLARAAK